MQKIIQIFISDNNQEMSLKLKNNSEKIKNLYYDYKHSLKYHLGLDPFLYLNSKRTLYGKL